MLGCKRLKAGTLGAASLRERAMRTTTRNNPAFVEGQRSNDNLLFRIEAKAINFDSLCQRYTTLLMKILSNALLIIRFEEILLFSANSSFFHDFFRIILKDSIFFWVRAQHRKKF